MFWTRHGTSSILKHCWLVGFVFRLVQGYLTYIETSPLPLKGLKKGPEARRADIFFVPYLPRHGKLACTSARKEMVHIVIHSAPRVIVMS